MFLRFKPKSKEDRLLEGCRKGDPQQQRLLYEQVAPQMLSVCRRYVADAQEAESVMVQGFLKVFECIDSFSGEGKLQAWIRKIMVNECLMYLRKEKRAVLFVEVEEASHEAPLQADSDLQADELMMLIEQLPTGYRTVFNLYAIEGFSHQEIADQLEISINTSKSQLSRARQLLQQQIKALEKIEIKGNGNF
ncbi:sigma-70 family RNA polymerase sigma factor [Persicobacter psychrovividus]|uniref:DNA-directed RNA polymerase sigma-70 factor n=1 Tax=Persicobacter psychrovividus TaxID=387638 RepID=A0ABN6LAM0_9BACT|nr:DNA-directed RNA polymerase sigma-70 factor [Persicobacter psychrovividus]